MSRVESLRTLSRFNVHRRYHRTSDNKIDWGRPYFVVKPKGFDTILLTIDKPTMTADRDFTDLMDAVANLSQMDQPEIRKRKAKR